MDRIISRFAASAALRPNKVALFTEKNQLTYDDLLYLTQVFETRFRTSGVKPGDTLVVLAEQPEFIVVSYLLASRMSLTLVFSSVSLVRAAGLKFDKVLASEPVEGMADDPRLLMITDDWFAALGSGSRPDLSEAFGDGAAFIGTTSGSTGRPKFVRTPEMRHLIKPQGFRLTNAHTERTRFLSTMSARQGLTAAENLRTLLAGGSVVALREHRSRFLPYLDHYRVTYLQTSPFTLKQMIEVPQPGQYFASVEHVYVSGSMTSPVLLEGIAAISRAEIRYGYGLHEVGNVSSGLYDRDVSRPEGYLGEVGRDDIEIAFFDDELNLRPDANEGIIGFRPTREDTRRSYVGEIQSDGLTSVVDGYFIPGDLVRREGDSLYFLGRSKNILNMAGNKFSLEALQEALEVGCGIRHAACAAVPDAYGIENLHVFYEAESEIDTAAMNIAIAEQVGAVSVGRAVRLDRMPTTENGKIDISQVRLMAKNNSAA